MEEMIEHSHLPVHIASHEKYDWRFVSDVSMVASGTATLEGAIIGTPMIIIYRVSFFTYSFARWMIKLPYIGLVNLVAGEKVVPELLQYDFTPDKLSKETLTLLDDRTRLDTIRNELASVREQLGQPGASQRAAKAVLKVLKLD